MLYKKGPQLPTREMKKKMNSGAKTVLFCLFYKEIPDLPIVSNLANLGWFLKISFDQVLGHVNLDPQFLMSFLI